jgi:structure-specific endonuclease subunit SLX1
MSNIESLTANVGSLNVTSNQPYNKDIHNDSTKQPTIAIYNEGDPLCYLLKSLKPGFDHTYIGYSINRRRRIRQHNGEIVGGAKKTLSGRPWKMHLIVFGFASNLDAYQFEWAWQHPRRSKLVKRYMPSSMPKGSGRVTSFKYRMEVLRIMRTIPRWKNLQTWTL